jgi:putative transposase
VQAMIAFIDDHRVAYGVEPICKLLPIAPSTYHAHAAKRIDAGKRSARARRDAELKIEIERVFAENFGVYGARKVWRQLQREGFDVPRCTVERLMADLGLQGVVRGKPVRTTVSDKAAPCPLDHVNRQFHARRPNALWVSDFTYVATWSGFVYVAFVIDAYARRIVGWRVSRTAHAGFVLDALEQALHERRPFMAAGWSTTATEATSICRSATPSAWRKPGSSRPLAASATATTTPSPRRSTASTRPRSSIDADRGGPSRPSSSRHWNGWTGSTAGGFWSPSATSRRPKPRRATTPCSKSSR